MEDKLIPHFSAKEAESCRSCILSVQGTEAREHQAHFADELE